MDPVNDVPQVSAIETARLLESEQVTLVDVREPHEWQAGHVAQAVHVPLGALTLEAVPTGKPVVVMCHAGSRSQAAAEALRGAGVDASNMAGGVLAWEGADLPLSRP